MSDPRQSGYVGWGGKTKWVTADQILGMGSRRGVPDYGIRRALWDAAMGYVSGFDKRDILYYVLTRSLNKRFSQWSMEREGIEFRDGVPLAPKTST